MFPRALPQVYKNKHLNTKYVSTNICESAGHSNELSEFECGAVTGYLHLSKVKFAVW